jgi:hypothetical protein
MIDTIKSETALPTLDHAFHLAATMSWEELRQPSDPRSVHVEYLCEPDVALDYLSV